jgi:signal transduction histidine kinase
MDLRNTRVARIPTARHIFAVAVALAGAVCGAPVQADDSNRYRIVTLNAADPYLPAFVALDQAMRDEIRARLGPRAEFYAETLDMLRFPRAQFEQQILALLREKYRDLKVDVVVANAKPALEFAERHGGDLWPGAAIVFKVVPTWALQGRTLGPRTTGTPVRYEIRATLDLALRLRPGARRIVVVGGTAEFDHSLVAQARTTLDGYSGRLDIEYAVGAPLSETLATVRGLPSDAIVLYLSMFRDGADAPLVPRDVITQIAAAAGAPVFGIFEPALGQGIVAGRITSNEAQGRRAGELVARVLNGERPSDLGVQPPVSPGCIADWRQLHRWNIAEKLVPEDCEVRFRELTPWDLYRWQILSAVTIMLVQAALIVALLAQRRRRQRAEVAVQRHRVELWHASRLATAGELTAAIAHEVDQPLGAILLNVDAVEMLLATGNAHPDEVTKVLADLRKDDLRATEVIRRLRALLAKHEMVREPVDLNAAIADVLRLLDAEARRRNVQLASDLDSTLPKVLGDRVHLQQVLLNLVINAMDAMADIPVQKRRIIVRTTHGARDVEVAVKDFGHGIAADRLPKLFESFYTTKEHGMGLGLSIARSIVEAHAGRIWAEANDQGGATFRFAIPAADAKVRQ